MAFSLKKKEAKTPRGKVPPALSSEGRKGKARPDSTHSKKTFRPTKGAKYALIIGDDGAILVYIVGNVVKSRHFVADAPPQELVDALVKAFHDSDGDLGVVSAALVSHDLAWSAPAAKIRNPNEFVIAAMRATGFIPSEPGQILNLLNALGMPLWQPAGPNGYGDTAAVWASPEQMKLRLDVAWQMAQRARDAGPPLGVLDTACGFAASRETRDAIAHAESRPQALALLFMSPEFQRR